MSLIGILFLILEGGLFLAWAFFMFRTLFRLNRHATAQRQARGGNPFMGLGETISTFGAFARGQIFPSDRKLLVILTLALFAMIALRVMLIGAA
ncbi:MAG: hypothetical protein ACPH5G_01600 [Pseudooceanicola atlanticus]